ncbi:MAG: hypothetical protein GX916_05950, partial [Clostridiales bacterium]|nr:hypothetical protein [Clostridiales bacterium]
MKRTKWQLMLMVVVLMMASIIHVSAGAVPIAIEPPTGGTFTYDGNEKTGVDAGTGYNLSEATPDQKLKATAAGNYEVTATLETGYVWDVTDGSSTTDPRVISWSIAKAEVAVPEAV